MKEKAKNSIQNCQFLPKCKWKAMRLTNSIDLMEGSRPTLSLSAWEFNQALCVAYNHGLN